MPQMHRISRILAVSVCLIGSGWSDTVFASEPPASSEVVSTPAISSRPTQPFAAGQPSRLRIGEQTRRALTIPLTPSMDASQLGVSYAQRGWYRGGGRRRNGAAQAEMILGAVAAITGAAVLTYANRPECSANALADGCSYGTKVVGTAVTAGGIVTFLTGALTWR
jgi:hypothetical protein